MTDLSHLGGAVAAGVTEDGARSDNWGGPPVPARIGLFHRLWADQYVRLLADGDTGAAFRHLHRLRHEEPDADPWRLLEQVAKRALALSTPDAGNGVNVSPQSGDGTAAAGSEGGEQGLPPSPAQTRPAPDPAPGSDPSEGTAP